MFLQILDSHTLIVFSCVNILTILNLSLQSLGYTFPSSSLFLFTPEMCSYISCSCLIFLLCVFICCEVKYHECWTSDFPPTHPSITLSISVNNIPIHLLEQGKSLVSFLLSVFSLMPVDVVSVYKSSAVLFCFLSKIFDSTLVILHLLQPFLLATPWPLHLCSELCFQNNSHIWS